jgi:hypothetical protein
MDGGSIEVLPNINPNVGVKFTGNKSVADSKDINHHISCELHTVTD